MHRLLHQRVEDAVVDGDHDRCGRLRVVQRAAADDNAAVLHNDDNDDDDDDDEGDHDDDTSARQRGTSAVFAIVFSAVIGRWLAVPPAVTSLAAAYVSTLGRQPNNCKKQDKRRAQLIARITGDARTDPQSTPAAPPLPVRLLLPPLSQLPPTLRLPPRWYSTRI